MTDILVCAQHERMNVFTVPVQVGFDRPLLMPKTEEVEMLTKQREDTLIARMKMFVHLRQDLERVCLPQCCYLLVHGSSGILLQKNILFSYYSMLDSVTLFHFLVRN